MSDNTQTCMYPNCTEPSSGTGGLCQAHYRTLRLAVREKKHTWAEYVALGIASPLKIRQGNRAERMADLERVIAQAVQAQKK